MLLSVLNRLFAALVAAIAVFTPLWQQGTAQLAQDKAAQIARVAALEKAYAAGTVALTDEGSLFAGDLDNALQSGVRFNELRFVATHNSYQSESVPELQMWYGIVNRISFGLVPANGGEYQSRTLTEQLSGGVRSLELDVEALEENGETSFVCLHSPVLDMTTHSYDFSLALREIRLWSCANPGHLPITLLIEPKVLMLPMENMEVFTLQSARKLEDLLRSELGESLLTPAELLGDYPNFSAMRAADDWPRASELCGRVFVLLHPTLITNAYVAADPSLRSQAMFPVYRPAERFRKQAAFLLENDPAKVKRSWIEDDNFILRVRADSFGKISPQTRQAALDCGAQMLSTDYPPLPGETEAFSFANGKPMTRS